MILPFRFLATVDKLGTAYKDPVIATGYGAYMATPILRKAYEENSQMSKEEAIQLIYKVNQVLFYRDARSFPKVSTKQIKIRVRVINNFKLLMIYFVLPVSFGHCYKRKGSRNTRTDRRRKLLGTRNSIKL